MSTPLKVIWRQFLCRACGLIYDEEKGDPDSGLAPGTRFEDIPDDWECPLCGVIKADFELYDGTSKAYDASADPARLNNHPRKAGIVIVGAGIAGWSAAEALRQLDADVPITVVTACSGDRYHKPELSVAIGRGMSAEQLVKESAVNAADRLRLKLLTDTFVVGLTPTLNKVRTTRGPLPYTKLVFALGAKPALPESLPKSLVWRVNDLATWAGLRARLTQPQRRIAIVGAGMIGCELAEDFARAGHQVTLLDMHAYPLATLLPALVGNRLQKHLASLGVEYIPGTTVANVIATSDSTKRMLTAEGRCLDFDEVVAATGLKTDPRIPHLGKLAFDRGIVVNPHTLQTSEADIYALGDCISIHGSPCRFIEPLAKQATAFAHHALGRPHDGYQHLSPMIRLKAKGFPLVMHGNPSSDLEWSVLADDDHYMRVEQNRNGQRIASLELNYRSESRPA